MPAFLNRFEQAGAIGRKKSRQAEAETRWPRKRGHGTRCFTYVCSRVGAQAVAAEPSPARHQLLPSRAGSRAEKCSPVGSSPPRVAGCGGNLGNSHSLHDPGSIVCGGALRSRSEGDGKVVVGHRGFLGERGKAARAPLDELRLPRLDAQAATPSRRPLILEEFLLFRTPSACRVRSRGG